MLNAIVGFSVRYRSIVIALGIGLLVYGLMVLGRTKYDVFPEFAPPQVGIQTESPGFSPEQVEALVTKPIEDAINGAAGVAVVRSQSIQGLSVITAIFAEQTDIYRARQVLAERLSEVARRLPATARAPVMTPLTSSTSTVLVFGITSAARSLREQRTFADWTLRPRLLAVPGVARVSVFGGEVRQLQIQLDPEQLRALGLGIDEVAKAAQQATGVRGAGFIEDPNQRLILITEGQLLTPDLLAGAVVRERNGAVLRIGDLGRVVEGSEPAVGAAAVEGTPGIIVVVSGQLGANTRVVTVAVERGLDELGPAIRAAGLTLHPALFRPANFIDVALHNVTTSLVIGGVLVMAVLLLFLFDVGVAGVALTAIPLSLLAAIIVLDWFGFTVNTLTLGGLAIAVGTVVDDAIIDVENIARRLRENRALPDPLPTAQVVLVASLEVRHSVVYATFIVALVFLPIMGMTGVQGALFRPLAIAHTLAILASLAVALTVTPALTLTLLAGRGAHREPPVVAGLKRRFSGLLAGIVARPKRVIAMTAALVVAAAAMVPFFGGAFLPEFREGHFIIHMQAVPGTSLEESLRIGRAVTAALRADLRVRSVAQRVGRAELADDTWGTHYSEFEVDLVPLRAEAAEAIQSDLRDRLLQFPGVTFAIKPFLSERIEEVLTGSTAQVVIKLFGDDLDSLDAAARAVVGVVRRVPGAADVQYGAPPVAPEALVRLRPGDLTAFGVRADAALTAVETATRGATVGQTFEGNRATDVVVILDPKRRERPEDLLAIPLTSAGGRLVTLSQVADVARTTGRYSIAHEGARRLQTVTANVGGRDVASFTSELAARLAVAPLPHGVYAEVGGTATAQNTAQRELLLRSLLAAAGIVMLLWMAFGEPRRVLLIMANLPFALVGGAFAVFATGGLLSLGSLVGFVTLFGITTRNAIMLISHYDHLLTVEGATWGVETAIRGAAERLGPILMTALVTGLGLLPLALGSGDPGREIEGPMAIVILGGLLTSTALSLLVLPTFALLFGRFGEPIGVRQSPPT
jgi:CzcA family heavy metal efflux pump